MTFFMICTNLAQSIYSNTHYLLWFITYTISISVPNTEIISFHFYRTFPIDSCALRFISFPFLKSPQGKLLIVMNRHWTMPLVYPHWSGKMSFVRQFPSLFGSSESQCSQVTEWFRGWLTRILCSIGNHYKVCFFRQENL